MQTSLKTSPRDGSSGITNGNSLSVVVVFCSTHWGLGGIMKPHVSCYRESPEKILQVLSYFSCALQQEKILQLSEKKEFLKIVSVEVTEVAEEYL
jgi:hypothetical protein